MFGAVHKWFNDFNTLSIIEHHFSFIDINADI